MTPERDAPRPPPQTGSFPGGVRAVDERCAGYGQHRRAGTIREARSVRTWPAESELGAIHEERKHEIGPEGSDQRQRRVDASQVFTDHGCQSRPVAENVHVDDAMADFQIFPAHPSRGQLVL